MVFLEPAGFQLDNCTALTVEVPTSASDHLDFIRMFTGDHYLGRVPQAPRAKARARIMRYLERDGLTLTEKSTIMLARRPPASSSRAALAHEPDRASEIDAVQESET